MHGYPDLWAGVILYTLTPCIGWYLIFTDLAEGDVPWGVSLMPWNLVLQIALLPLYLWLLVGEVVPTPAGTLLGSVALYLLAPLALAYAARLILLRRKGREWTYGPYKSAIGEVKMWALAVLVVAIFAFQPSFSGLGLLRIGLIIAVISCSSSGSSPSVSPSAGGPAWATPTPRPWSSPPRPATPSR